jgi:exosortase
MIAFPVFLALAMVPPPNILYGNLTLRLKLVSSQIGVIMLQLCGLTAYREGNVIDLGFTRLQVVDACSGLRYFFPLIVLGILLAYYFKGAIWKKIFIVVSAIPISIVTNSIRIASVGILYQFMGSAAAEGFFHDFSGWFIFMISLGILLLEMALLKHIYPDKVFNKQQGTTFDDASKSNKPEQ